MQESLQNATFLERLSIKKQINDLTILNEKYYKVQNAIDAFKIKNPEEFNILNNLASYGQKVNITIETSNQMLSSENGMGTTQPSLILNAETNEIYGVSSITITLYKLAFVGGSNGLSTLANEFGDALFAVARPQTQYNGYNDIINYRNSYWNDPSSRFSFDYEKYIMDPEHNKKPDPYGY